MPSHNVDTKKGGARKTQTYVIAWQKPNQTIAIKYNILAIEKETAMLTPPGYQNGQNNKQQTKTNILYTLETKKNLFRISLKLHKIDA